MVPVHRKWPPNKSAQSRRRGLLIQMEPPRPNRSQATGELIQGRALVFTHEVAGTSTHIAPWAGHAFDGGAVEFVVAEEIAARDCKTGHIGPGESIAAQEVLALDIPAAQIGAGEVPKDVSALQVTSSKVDVGKVFAVTQHSRAISVGDRAYSYD